MFVVFGVNTEKKIYDLLFSIESPIASLLFDMNVQKTLVSGINFLKMLVSFDVNSQVCPVIYCNSLRNC